MREYTERFARAAPRLIEHKQQPRTFLCGESEIAMTMESEEKRLHPIMDFTAVSTIIS